MQENTLEGAEAAAAMLVTNTVITNTTSTIPEAVSGLSGTALTAQQKKDLLNRLARIEGQLRGVQKLIVTAEVPADCAGIAQQMAAARKAMDRAFTTLLTSALVTQSSTAKSMTEAAERAQHLAGLLDKFA